MLLPRQRLVKTDFILLNYNFFIVFIDSPVSFCKKLTGEQKFSINNQKLIIFQQKNTQMARTKNLTEDEIAAKKLKQREYDQKRSKTESRIQYKRAHAKKVLTEDELALKKLKQSEYNRKRIQTDVRIQARRVKDKKYNATHKEYIKNRRAIRYQKEKEEGKLKCKFIGCSLHFQGGGIAGFCNHHNGTSQEEEAH
jgi:acetyl/propionyl-CoA carboxylase alpha subunit